MLLDIDHIACSSMQFNKHIEIMKSLDYQPEFLEKKRQEFIHKTSSTQYFFGGS